MTIPFWDEWEDIPAELFESLREADKSVENRGPIKLDVSVLEISGALWLEARSLRIRLYVVFLARRISTGSNKMRKL